MTSLFVLVALLAAPTAASADPPPPEAYDNFDGTGNAGGSGTEYGSRTWQALNGSWTRSGSGTVTTSSAPAANPMLVTDMGPGDADVRTVTTGSSGEAVYVRVQDGASWVRARLARTQTYFTDREYTYTYKQWEVNYYKTEYQWQDRWYQRQYTRTTYGSWSAWSTYATSACQSAAGEVSLPADTDTTQYRTANGSTSGCTGGKKKWDKQSRTRTKTVDNVWVTDGNAAPSGYTATGSTRYVNNGSPYWGAVHAWTGSNIPAQVGTRNVLDHTGWQNTGSVTAPDVLTGQVRFTTATNWWTQLLQNWTGNNDPCTYVNSAFTTSSCYLTGATRQGDPNGEVRRLVLEKSVGGAVSQLGGWDVGSISGFRVTASGSTIKVYSGETTLLGTVTDSTYSAQTRHGCGLGGGNDLLSPTNALTYCYLRTTASTSPPTIGGLGLTPKVNSTTSVLPTFYATPSDTDSTSVQAEFEISNSAGVTIYSTKSDWDSPGTVVAAWLPTGTLQVGQSYSVRTRAIDPGGLQSAWSTAQSFQVVAPPAGDSVAEGDIDLYAGWSDSDTSAADVGAAEPTEPHVDLTAMPDFKNQPWTVTAGNGNGGTDTFLLGPLDVGIRAKKDSWWDAQCPGLDAGDDKYRVLKKVARPRLESRMEGDYLKMYCGKEKKEYKGDPESRFGLRHVRYRHEDDFGEFAAWEGRDWGSFMWWTAWHVIAEPDYVYRQNARRYCYEAMFTFKGPSGEQTNWDFIVISGETAQRIMTTFPRDVPESYYCQGTQILP